MRARFAATELGIREKLVVVMLAQSTLSVALNATIGEHVPRLLIYADAARIDADMSALTNLVPYRAASGGGVGGSQRAHTHILNSIFDQVRRAPAARRRPLADVRMQTNELLIIGASRKL